MEKHFLKKIAIFYVETKLKKAKFAIFALI